MTKAIHNSPNPLASEGRVERLHSARVLLVGLGNIGSFLAVLLAPLVAFIRLVDRDTVEMHNVSNQFYGPEHTGQTKVDVTADRLEQLVPGLQVQRRVADLEDLPWEDFADIDIAVAGLDSLRARQIMSEKLYPLQIPYIDGATGDPQLVRVQILMPEQACLECSWGPAHYRQLSTEYPCDPRALAQPARTMAPGCAGAATASVIVAQCTKLFEQPLHESYEINGDLLAGRFVMSRRRRNESCLFRHERPPQVVRLQTPFAEASVVDLLAAVERAFDRQPVWLEFRRGILDGGLFGPGCLALPEQLHHLRHRRLDDLRLTTRDRVVVRGSERTSAVHICFDKHSEGPS